MLVGIGGVSRAGKSTLADLLCKQFLSQGASVLVFRQDEFPVSESRLPLIRDRPDWEVPQSIMHDDLYDAIRSQLSITDIIFIEGLYCFYDERLVQLMAKKILVEISKPIFIARKSVDLRWGSAPEPEWYIQHIWEQYTVSGLPHNLEGYLRVGGENYFNLIQIMNYLEREE